MPRINLGLSELVGSDGQSIAVDNKLRTTVDNPLKIGHAISGSIGNTESILDLTPLIGLTGYPMDIELESRDVACYVRQGGATVTLSGVNARIQADQWRRVVVEDVTDAYIAFQNTATDETGTLIALRIDICD